jgi:hypothetical protein
METVHYNYITDYDQRRVEPFVFRKASQQQQSNKGDGGQVYQDPHPPLPIVLYLALDER